MPTQKRYRASARLGRRASILTGALAAALTFAGAWSVRADEHMVLVDTIDVGGAGLGAFDISFVDPKIDLYVLSDRTNASVDFFDASDDTFTTRVPGFKGVVLTVNGMVNNSLSGPDGVTYRGSLDVWAGDGDSTVKVIDIATVQITDTISTGGKFRVDEMAYDSKDHILAMANNADTPPFVTLINTDSHAILGTNRVRRHQRHAECHQRHRTDPRGRRKPDCSTPRCRRSAPIAPTGGISVIDPSSMKVVATFPVQNCSPAGLTVGPMEQALIGCSGAFGTAPNVLTQSIIISLVDGDVKATIPQVGGSDEVWYDRGTRHYYLGARNNMDPSGKLMPVLGTIDAGTNVFDGNVATSTTAHSVAADRVSHHVFVPIGFVPPGSPAGTDATNPCPDARMHRGLSAVVDR